jgi:hypothetical protein
MLLHALPPPADWKDSNGRVFPGYPDARSPPYNKAKLNYAQCWDESAPPIFVRTIDICPCHRPEAQGGYNRACCMTAPHFDLSYWAFEVRTHACIHACCCSTAHLPCCARECVKLCWMSVI